MVIIDFIYFKEDIKMEEKTMNEVTEVTEEKVDLSTLTTKELRKELAKRGVTKAKAGASRAKKWVLGALAIGGAAAGGMAVGYHLKATDDEPTVVMWPDEDGSTVGEVLDSTNSEPTENTEN